MYASFQIEFLRFRYCLKSKDVYREKAAKKIDKGSNECRTTYMIEVAKDHLFISREKIRETACHGIF